MFLPREMPLDLGPEHLLGLRVSLNTPVVSTEEVPTGPARAALAVHRDGGGAATITLAVRPIQASHAVFYGLHEELRDAAGVATGVDAALSFGESLGFLFDEDAVAGGAADAREEALELWNSIVGDDELSKVMEITDRSRRASSASASILEAELGEELLLEELALEEESFGGESLEEVGFGDPPGPPRREPAPALPTPTLTKFRAVSSTADPQPPEPEPEQRPGRALLARVRLIKRAAKLERAPEEDPEPCRSLRLLASF